MSYINFLIQLTEKDKRILIALLIVLIVAFVLIAYIGNGIKSLLRRYGKRIDGYMHELCSAGLVTTPRQFFAQVFKKESRRLYFNTKWVLRVFILSVVGFFVYATVFKPSGEGNNLFEFAYASLSNLRMEFYTPKSSFFFFENFPVDFPQIVKYPEPVFDIPSIATYAMLLVTIASILGITNATLKFMGAISRARKKSFEVFNKTLDDANFSKV